MSAIFISYTGRDDEGEPIAVQVAEWLREWGYESFFRDKELKEGVPAGSDWRQLLHARLAQCRLLIAVCSPKYEESGWCMAEIAIAMDRGHKLLPLQLGKNQLPLLLQNKQAITIQEPIILPEPPVGEAAQDERSKIEAVRLRLKHALTDLLDWRAKMTRLPDHTSPYPGLLAFDETNATVYFGRDDTIAALEQRVLGLRGYRSEFLLLQGASGCGKSSLLRAGLIPRLRSESGHGFLVVDPFRLDLMPMKTLATMLSDAMQRDGVESEFTPEGSAMQFLEDCADWRLKTKRQDAMVVLPIDQFEDLFSGIDPDGGDDKAAQFLRFLADLLSVARGRVLVLATIRTDYLTVLESWRSKLKGEGRTLRWSAEPIEPMEPALYSEVIEGPARQAGLTPEPGLTSALVADTGSGDALPLLAFTLKELWGYHAKRQFQPEQVEGVGLVHLLRRDLKTIGGVSGSVSRKADDVVKDCSASELEALRDAFLGHLVRLNEEGEGGAAKQRAPLAKLPPASQEVVRQLVEERLLVSDAGDVEIAHEALLRTWPTLVGWIKEGREELLQCLRVKRLADDLKPTAAERQRRQALEQLAALAATGGSEQLAVRKEAKEPLSALLAWVAAVGAGSEQAVMVSVADREDAALVLALIGAEEPLRVCLANTNAPVALRRRAAESLGLLARRSGKATPEAITQRQRIETELEGWLRSDALDLLVESDAGWNEHDARLPLLQGASRGLQLAASADLPLLGSGAGRVVPMLTLTALEEGRGLRIRTEVVEVPVWQLPLPGGEQLELVVVPEGPAQLGSPATEHDRKAVMDWFAATRDGCRDGVDAEALRPVRLEAFGLVRQPISQGQWRAVVEVVGEIERDLDPAPGAAKPESLWERHGQPGELAVDSVSWNQCREWLGRLNRWLVEQWGEIGGGRDVPQLTLPSENQWEGACRAGAATPFHFGDALDGSWARYDATAYPFGRSRKGVSKPKQPWVNGSSGVVNRWGLAELHGQLYEWCEDAWHPNPVGQGHPDDGQPWREEDRDLVRRESGQRGWKLLRGGSWIGNPHYCRAAVRNSSYPDYGTAGDGLRPACCPSPPGSLLGP